MNVVPQVTPAQLSVVRDDVAVLDVREPEEVACGRISGSSNIPLGQLAGRLGELELRRPVIVVCQSGRRSQRAAELLTVAGFMVSNLAGGMNAWASDGGPTASHFSLVDTLPRTVGASVQIDVIETTSLGDRSYLISDAGVAVVIDPQRDIDRLLKLAADRGVRISHVLETHVHNDYVSGGLELAKAVGAVYAVPAGDKVSFERVPAADGDVLEAGRLRFRVLHTPGHTQHHVSYVLSDADGNVQAVFTGGSMLYGATGRTDLVGPEHTDELAHAQFHSVRRLAAELPPRTPVFPTHGFGSFCSATPTSGDASTVGEQSATNPALTQDEQAFVDQLIAGLGDYPAYYAHMGPINGAGPDPADLSKPRLADPAELARRLLVHEWVVDLRTRTAFAAGHLPGALNFELSDNFVTYLGWLYDWGAPLTLIAETPAQVADARRQLMRIGINRLAAAAIGRPEELTDGRPLASYPVTDFAGLAQAMTTGTPTVLDARRVDERADGGVRDSLHIPLHRLRGRLKEVPQGEVWVYCGSGYRASIAASILARAGYQPVLVDGRYDDPATGAAAAGLHTEPVSA